MTVDASSSCATRNPNLQFLVSMAYFFASAIDVDIKLEGEELRKQVEVKSDKDKNITCPVYYDGDSVTGQVHFFVWKMYPFCEDEFNP